MLERLQKILSARGIASRRKAEEYIEQGLVKVNGHVAKLGDKADPDIDTIEVDGKVTQERTELLYYLMYKPAGVVTSNVERWSDSKRALTEGQKRSSKRKVGDAVPQSLRDTTIRDLLPKELQGVIYPVGRLDKESSGLLLLTNDGPLAYRLTHPKFDHEKEYEVTVDKAIADSDLQKMAEGMFILGSKTKEAALQRISPTSFAIALTEGKNRQIRRMCEKLGYRVRELKRVRIVNISDDTIKPGAIRHLTQKEKQELLRLIGI